MKTIVPAAELVTRILGKQTKRDDADYRLLRFCVQCPVADGTLLYNAMTLELLLLSPEETSRLTENTELISKWFFVPQEQDDHALADQLREIAAHVQKPTTDITSYTIFTTTNCNARCYYCFEQGCMRKNMNRDTANRLVRYITEHSGGKEIALHWFGGEPLLGQEAIDTVCQGLSASGVPYRSSITTNGYLFDEATIQKATTLWKLTSAQITLDGTEEVYNRTKAFVHPDASPFLRVLQHIGLLLNAGVHVSIRLNVSEDNRQDLLRLAEQLAEQFKGKQGLFVYPNPLYEQAEDESKWVRTHSASLMEKYREVLERLTELRLYRDRRLPRSIKLTHCMADNDGAVAVLPDGALGCCEHFTESEIFGHIDCEERDNAVLAVWKERTPPGQECASCAYYPQCFLLKKCPSERTCTADDREATENRLRSQMQNEYRIYVKQQTAEEVDLPPENC